jgi:HK97 family phage major capsid protein
MSINDINARLGEIDAELETLAGLTDPTPEDAARAEALELEATEQRKARVEAMERRERIEEAHAKAKAEGRAIAGSSFEFQKKVEPYDADLRNLDVDQLGDSARSILDRPEARHLAADQKEKVENLVGRHGQPMSRLLIATSRPQYRTAWMKHATGNTDLLTNDERRAVAEVRGTQMVLADANGGYAVPALLDPSVILTSNGTANPMRQISRIVTGMDDTWRGVSSAGVTASWDSEAIEVSEDGPTLAQPTVVSHKAQAFVSFSVEVEGDWMGIAGELATMFADAKDTLEEAAFSTGAGDVNTPTGVLTALFAGSAVTAVTVTTDGQFGAVDVRAAFGALGARYRRNASWVASIDVQNEIRGFDTSGGLSNQTVDLTAPYSFALLGKPVYECSGFPAFSGTTGAANILVVGDFRNYVIFDRVGSRTEFVPHLFATGSNRPNGTRGLLFWWRVGADSVNDAAFRLLLNT